MRKTTILSVCLALACATSANAQSSEFDALLEDVTFGAAEQMVNTQAEDLVPEVTAPAPEATMTLPPAPQVTDAPAPVVDQPVAPQPVAAQPAEAPLAMPAEPVVAAPVGDCGQGCSSCQTCDSGRGCGHKKNRIRDTACIPYTVPRLPSSTFYQYWRTNACYTNVWDGFRNHCPRQIDLSIDKKKKGCSGCASGGCLALPADWAAASSATCDSCDSRR